ncbi:MAG TPA: Gfo/Idh/MocA family oxidoreductase [Abditibacteriaceae bacterium]|jgi:predicted dehydrogenase
MNNSRTKIGLIGCGNISGAYFNTNKSYSFFDIVACADLDVARAQAKADEYSIAKACSVEDLLADPEIEMVINLTIPAAHGPIAIQALQAGKSVYNEKPLAVTREEAQQMLQIAREKSLRVGCAPDTFLGGGIQTCRKLIDEGWIGEPVAVTAFMMGRGHESWHPSPLFYYQRGGGPMFDMGPYYLTALVSLLGPVRRVTGSTRITFPQRTITSQPLAGQVMDVEVDTHVAGIMDFHSGPIATLITSFDVYQAPHPPITIFGSHGTLAVPDPNSFGGPVKLFRPGNEGWNEVPLAFGYTGNSRGVGMADMALAIKQERPHRASGELAYHVLDLMQAFHDSSREGRHIEMQSTCERPAPLPMGLRDGELDA